MRQPHPPTPPFHLFPGVYPGDPFFMSINERRVRVVCPANTGPGAMVRVRVAMHPDDRYQYAYQYRVRYRYTEDDNVDCFDVDEYDYDRSILGLYLTYTGR